MNRFYELAREQAFVKHSHFVLMTSTQGHVQGMNDKEWGFSACPHPDCALVNAGPATPTPEGPPSTLRASISGAVACIRSSAHLQTVMYALADRLQEALDEDLARGVASGPAVSPQPEPVTAKEQHLLDVYQALGVEWGENVFAQIDALKRAYVSVHLDPAVRTEKD